jgi:hypothetical protein
MDCFPPCSWANRRQPRQRDTLNKWLRNIPPFGILPYGRPCNPYLLGIGGSSEDGYRCIMESLNKRGTLAEHIEERHVIIHWYAVPWEPIPHIIGGKVVSSPWLATICHVFPIYMTCHRVVIIVIWSVFSEPLRECHVGKIQLQTGDMDYITGQRRVDDELQKMRNIHLPELFMRHNWYAHGHNLQTVGHAWMECCLWG